MKQKFGEPITPPVWQTALPRPQLGKKPYQSSPAVYFVPDRSGLKQLDVFYTGPVGKPVITQVSWATMTKNGWSVRQAADDVGISLNDYKEVPRDKGYTETTRFFIFKKDPKIRAILYNANGSRYFFFERVL